MNRLEITRRVEALRNYMRKHALAAFIFPSTDLTTANMCLSTG